MIKSFAFISLSFYCLTGFANSPQPTADNAPYVDAIEMAEQELIIEEQALELRQQTLQKHVNFCAPCHGVFGSSDIEIYPNLAGQSQQYLYKQLLAFKYRRRKNEIMQGMVTRLTEQDMFELANYYAAQDNGISAPIEGSSNGN